MLFFNVSLVLIPNMILYIRFVPSYVMISTIHRMLYLYHEKPLTGFARTSNLKFVFNCIEKILASRIRSYVQREYCCVHSCVQLKKK